MVKSLDKKFKISSKINDSIKPSVNFLVSSRIEIEENKEIINDLKNNLID